MAGYRLSGRRRHRRPHTGRPQAGGLHDRYLDTLDLRLPGPGRARDAVLAEIADGLQLATDRNLATGLPAEQAAHNAETEFGDPAQVAAAFAPELVVGQARRTLRAFLLTGPLVGVWWLVLLAPRPWRLDPVELWAAIPALPLLGAGVATAVTALAATGPVRTWLPEISPRGALTATQAVALICIIGDLTVLGVLAGRVLSGADAVSALAAVATTASLLRLAYATGRVGAGRQTRSDLAANG